MGFKGRWLPLAAKYIRPRLTPQGCIAAIPRTAVYTGSERGKGSESRRYVGKQGVRRGVYMCVYAFVYQRSVCTISLSPHCRRSYLALSPLRTNGLYSGSYSAGGQVVTLTPQRGPGIGVRSREAEHEVCPPVCTFTIPKYRSTTCELTSQLRTSTDTRSGE
jgi:hypothetical protein